MFCKDCGFKMSDNAVACPKCGCPARKDSGVKKPLVALLLCLFLGSIGAHRFYVGKIGSAVAMLLLTLTGFGMIITGIWSLVDFIIICCGNFTDKNGRKLAW